MRLLLAQSASSRQRSDMAAVGRTPDFRQPRPGLALLTQSRRSGPRAQASRDLLRLDTGISRLLCPLDALPFGKFTEFLRGARPSLTTNGGELRLDLGIIDDLAEFLVEFSLVASSSGCPHWPERRPGAVEHPLPRRAPTDAVQRSLKQARLVAAGRGESLRLAFYISALSRLTGSPLPNPRSRSAAAPSIAHPSASTRPARPGSARRERQQRWCSAATARYPIRSDCRSGRNWPRL